MEHSDVISVKEAARQIGVVDGTLYYYIRKLKIETKRFELDRKAYLARSDFEHIKTLKDQARARSGA